MTAKVEEFVTRLVAPILDERYFELVEIVFRREAEGWMLRLFIDKEGGISIADCQWVSEQLSALLDVEGPIPYRYRLEVSSPGVERALKKESDFHRFSGRKVKVKYHLPSEGKKTVVGILQAYQDQRLILTIDSDQHLEIPRDQVVAVNLVFDFPKN